MVEGYRSREISEDIRHCGSDGGAAGSQCLGQILNSLPPGQRVCDQLSNG